MDLSNEKLKIDFGQGAVKISDVKVGGRKKYLPTQPPWVHRSRTQQVGRYFFQPLTLTSDIFAAP